MFSPFSWLCEINASPSLTASNQTDYNIKEAMLSDVLNVLDMEGRYASLIYHNF